MNHHVLARSALSRRLGDAIRLPAIAAGAGLLVAVIAGIGSFLEVPTGVAGGRVFSAVVVIGAAGGLAALAATAGVVRRRVSADVSTPIADLVAAATRAALDDFRGEVSPSGVSELREIASGFNHLLRLQRQQQHFNQTALDAVASRQRVATEAAMLHVEAEAASFHDALTGLFNRRKLDIDLAAECERSSGSQEVFTYVMVDIDHFKKFNDTHGHQGGDDLLRHLGTLLRETARTTDRCYRYGGEEFAIVLRGATPDTACIMVDRLRQRVADRFSELGTPVTASFGVAGFPGSGRAPEELIMMADGALYAAKEQGRNRVILAPTGPTVPG